MKTVYRINLVKGVLTGFLLLTCKLAAGAGEDIIYMTRAVEAAPVLDNIEINDLLYITGGGRATITNTLTVSDKDSRRLWSAIVKITKGYVAGEDVLTFISKDGISQEWNPVTGELFLTGRSSVANYQAALRSIQYENMNTINASMLPRVVSFQVRDIFEYSNIVTRNIVFQSTNVAPILSNMETSTLIYCEKSPPVIITSTLRIQDPDNSNLTQAKVWISEGYSSDKVLRFTDQNGITGSWNEISGTMTLSGKASVSIYQTALRSVAYENTKAVAEVKNTVISFVVSDEKDWSNEMIRRILDNGHVSGILVGSGSFCGDQLLNAPLEIDLTGTPPWNITLIRNNKNDLNYNNITTDPFGFTVNQEGTYRLKSISDAHCAGDTNGSGKVMILLHSKPTAHISGADTICEGETSELQVDLTGTAPWSITWLLNGQNPTTVNNITSNHYALPVTRDGTYTLSGVRDAFCDGTVTGSALIRVIQVPQVTITGLSSTYNKQTPDWIPITGTPSGGTFYGPGLIPYDNNWYFVPSLPPAGTHYIVYAYQVAPGTCFSYDTAVVRILEADAIIEFPDGLTRYCRNEDPFTITGINLPNIIGSFAISGGTGLIDNHDNTATIDPALLGANEYTVTYTYFDGTNLSFASKFEIGNPPDVDFIWESECFAPGQSIAFNNISTSTFGIISGTSWKVYTNTGYDTATTWDLTYTFPEPGNYLIELLEQTSYGCVNIKEKTYFLRPTRQLKDETFLEDFETASYSWLSSVSEPDSPNSWMLGEPTEGFSGASSGDYCWYTYIPTTIAPREHSWITSPCFDFTGTEKPMLKMDIWRLFNSNRDGANLQATVDSGKTWMLIGQLDDGIYWFNNYNIRGNPGGSSVGWSNIADAGWIEARHSLDMLKGKSAVQFRIAYGSDGSAQNNHGIAIDNFWIGERNRIALMEHFTNTSDVLSAKADSTLNFAISADSLNVIGLQYHTSFPGPDPFYEQEPYILDARVLYYGLSEVPYAILNGGTRTTHLFDYGYRELDTRIMYLESLLDSKYEILIQKAEIAENSINIIAEVTAKENLPARELTVHVVVIERKITSVTGGNGETTFENVVKTMLPDAGGTTLYKAWSQGEKRTIDNSWNMEHLYDPDELRVVVFVQDESTHEIYQAAISAVGELTGTEDELTGKGPGTSFNVYPNPASKQIFVRFDKPVTGDVKIEMYNALGGLVHSGQISTGIDETELSVGGFPNGMYLVRVTSGNKMLGIKKLTLIR